jgi:WD40 repeat protein
LLFCKLADGSQQHATKLRDEKWDSWTCPLGWASQGIWSGSQDGSDINTVCRSHSGHLLAVGDDDSSVKLFRYPCSEEGSSAITYKGHSSHVMNVRWSVGDEYLVSVGGNDKCAFIWKHTLEEHSGPSVISQDVHSGVDMDHENVPPIPFASMGSPMALPTGGDESGCTKAWLGNTRRPDNPPRINSTKPVAELTLDWVYGFSSEPVGGFSSAPLTNNLFYNNENAVVYPTAGLGVILKSATNTGAAASQVFFKGHDDDVTCLTISADRRFVASGQVASKDARGRSKPPYVCIWDATDGRLITTISKGHTYAIAQVTFSPDGEQLLSIGADNNHIHCVWKDVGGSWSRVEQIASSRGDGNALRFSLWLKSDMDPSDPSIPTLADSNKYDFVSGGERAIHFWTIHGSSLKKDSGRFGKAKQVPLSCGTIVNTKQGKRLVTGTSSGSIYVFKGKEVVDWVEIHNDGRTNLMSICATRDRGYLMVGSNTGRISVLNSDLQLVSNFDIASLPEKGPRIRTDSSTQDDTGKAITNFGENKELACCITSLDTGHVTPIATDDGTTNSFRLLIGTKLGDIIEVETKTDGKDSSINLDLSTGEHRTLMTSHFKGKHAQSQSQVWGLAVCPDPAYSDYILSGGDDGTLRLWSISQRKELVRQRIPNDFPIRSLDWTVVIDDGSNGAGYESDEGAADTIPANGRGEYAFDPNGQHLIAVGTYQENKSTGRSKRRGKKGKKKTPASDDSLSYPGVLIYHLRVLEDSATGELIFNFVRRGECVLKSTSWVCDVKFSPNEYSRCLLGVATHDSKWYCYDVIELLRRPVGTKDLACGLLHEYTRSSAILHFDFSTVDAEGEEKGLYVQMTTQDEMLIFVKLDFTGLGKATQRKLITASASNIKHLNDDPELTSQSWATWTCHFGWPVMGIWGKGQDGSDINAVDRHPNNKLLVTSDDDGLVKLFRYPVAIDQSDFKSYTGHSSHVTQVKFTRSGPKGVYVVSAGGNDKSIMVWALEEN